jgi:hypothetical protein
VGTHASDGIHQVPHASAIAWRNPMKKIVVKKNGQYLGTLLG